MQSFQTIKTALTSAAALLKLNGADYVTINGLNTGDGTIFNGIICGAIICACAGKPYYS